VEIDRIDRGNRYSLLITSAGPCAARISSNVFASILFAYVLIITLTARFFGQNNQALMTLVVSFASVIQVRRMQRLKHRVLKNNNDIWDFELPRPRRRLWK